MQESHRGRAQCMPNEKKVKNVSSMWGMRRKKNTDINRYYSFKTNADKLCTFASAFSFAQLPNRVRTMQEAWAPQHWITHQLQHKHGWIATQCDWKQIGIRIYKSEQGSNTTSKSVISDKTVWCYVTDTNRIHPKSNKKRVRHLIQCKTIRCARTWAASLSKCYKSLLMQAAEIHSTGRANNCDVCFHWIETICAECFGEAGAFFGCEWCELYALSIILYVEESVWYVHDDLKHQRKL